MNRNSNQIIFASVTLDKKQTNRTTHISLQTNQIGSTNKATGAYNNDNQSLKLRNIALIYNNEDEPSNQS